MSNESLNLQVPGFKASQQGTQKPVLRAIWYLMFVVCSFVSLRMIIERVSYYFTYPTMLTFALIFMNTFPKVTFCPSYVNFQLNGVHQPPFYSAITRCGSPYRVIEDCKQPELWTSHKSAYGMAYTFNFEKANVSRYSMALFDFQYDREFQKKIFEDSSLKLLVHEDDDDIAYGCVTSSIDIDPHTLLQVTFTTEKTMYENVLSRPCQSQSDYRKCLRKCFDEIFSQVFEPNCRLEFMTTVNHLPLCNSAGRNMTMKAINIFTEAINLIDECACVKACDHLRFELNIDTDEIENETFISIDRGYPEDTEVLRERMSYTGYSLLCEVGGIIGFYLGACLITFIQLIQQLSSRLYAHVTAPKGKPYVGKHLAHSKECPCCNQPLPASAQ